MNNKIHPDLQRLFLDLIQIDAVSGKEQPVADFIRSVTASLGFPAQEDGAASLSGGNSREYHCTCKRGRRFPVDGTYGYTPFYQRGKTTVTG